MLALHNPLEAAGWLKSRVRGVLHADSRPVGAGDGFVAWPGAATDGRRHVAAALAQGAAACLIEAEGAEAFGFDEGDERIARYAGLKAATGPIAAAFHEDPSSRLDVLAVTGTNGKTSTAWWLAQALAAHDATRPCAVMGTLGIGVPPDLTYTGLTTPDPVMLQRELRAFAQRGFGACAIEASSIGIAERRLDGTRIAVAVFTNFTQDHLDYHGSMDAYWQAKARLFEWPGLRAAVINTDDLQGRALAERLATSSALDVWSCACGTTARLQAGQIRHRAAGLSFEVLEGAERAEVETALVGQYNVANLLGVIGVLRASGVALADAAAACAALTPVPGRMQLVGDGQHGPQVVVDYAHTPDALDKVLAALRPLTEARGGRLWCVFGCGGNRDAAKRPLMGAIACRLADRVVVTSDNPRLEPPEFIISQILAGMIGHDQVDVIENRADAVRHAVAHADPRDVVLLAGKGHEDYQDVGGVRNAYSDIDEAAAALRLRGAAS